MRSVCLIKAQCSQFINPTHLQYAKKLAARSAHAHIRCRQTDDCIFYIAIFRIIWIYYPTQSQVPGLAGGGSIELQPN